MEDVSSWKRMTRHLDARCRKTLEGISTRRLGLNGVVIGKYNYSKKSYTGTLHARNIKCLQIIIGFSTSSQHSKNRAHHRPRRAPQTPPSALVHRSSTTVRPRRTHRIRAESDSSCGPSTGSGSRRGSACPPVRPPSSRARWSGPSGRWKIFWFKREDSCMAVARDSLFSPD